MKNNFLYPVSVSGTTLLCDRDLIELVRKKGGDQLAEVLVNRLSHEKIKDALDLVGDEE